VRECISELHHSIFFVFKCDNTAADGVSDIGQGWT